MGKRARSGDHEGNGRAKKVPQGVHVPAAAAAILPDRKRVSEMEAEEQDTLLERVGQFNERLVRVLGDGVNALRKPDVKSDGDIGGVTSVEDMVLADMARLGDVALARDFVETILWRRLRSLSSQTIEGHESCGGDGANSESRSTPNGEKAKSWTESFRQAHMRTLTEKFKDDLEQLHEKENMTSERVQFLLRCLEEGADLFASCAS